MRILGIDPGLQRTGFGYGPPRSRLHVAYGDMSLRRGPARTEESGGPAT